MDSPMRTTHSLTIADSASLSDSADIEGAGVVAVEWGDSLQAETDGLGFRGANGADPAPADFVPIFSGGSRLIIGIDPTNAGGAVVEPPIKGWRHIKIEALDGGVADAQAGGDTLTLITRYVR